MQATLHHALPAFVEGRDYLEAGALLSYGRSGTEAARQFLTLIDKILRGAKPADLPVQQPTRFELMINLKTAKALHIAVPQSLLLRADDVIR